MTPLQQLIADRMAELDLSFRKAAERSKGRVSSATLNAITMGRHSGEFEDDTLDGIALALDVSPSQVREAAGLARAHPTEFRLPKKANNLSPSQRRAVLAMVNALLESSENGDHDKG